jgi:acetoacetyl-CoA synthetase
MVTQGQLLWQPPAEWVEAANITAFGEWLGQTRALAFRDYQAMWRWSVEDLDQFWAAIWEYFDVRSSTPYECVLANREMPGAVWFPGSRLNYAEHIFRRRRSDAPAMLYSAEDSELAELGWGELEQRVRSLAHWLRECGIGPGDRVAGYLTNSPEGVIAMLAAVSIGAIWTASSPEFGTPSVLDRFKQLEPKVLFCVDGYRYGGKAYDRMEAVRELLSQLPTVARVVLLPALDPDASAGRIDGAVSWHDVTAIPDARPLEFTQLPFDHPLWILFSSGTTGIPKAIVHSHGGILIEQMKLTSLHFNLKEGERLFFYTTLGWMMWNFLVSSMLVGVVPVLYDGNPNYPDAAALWRIVERSNTTLFGASPTYQQMQQQAGIVPHDEFDLGGLKGVMLAGSPVSADCMAWFYDKVKSDLWVMPGSGGTDVCSGFVGGVPGPAVRAGEIQGIHLGVDAHAFDEQGRSVINEVGELVITQPMPSMPVYLWNDDGNARYRETYFDTWPGVWRHGDFFMVNERGGCFVLGRSDATLNRYGVRIGTAEIYRCMEAIDEVQDSLIVNLELANGKFFMPLFVQLAEGVELDETLDRKICRALRERCSPRHVPDRIYRVLEIPYTLTGKKMEVPVRRILMGTPLGKAANPSVMRNPESLDYFVRFAKERILADSTTGP